VLAFGPSNYYSVNVNDIGLQISDYLATHPKITNKTLFIVWGGANDVLGATSERQIVDAGINQAINIQALIDAGAPSSSSPTCRRLAPFRGSTVRPQTSIPATQASELYNGILAMTISVLQEINFGRHIQFAQLDVFTSSTRSSPRPRRTA